MLYRLIRPLLYVLPAELAHRIGFGALRFFAALPGGKALLRMVYAARHPGLQTQALGLSFPNPIGLAAGFDKNAEGFEALGALGFGFVEIGTVTAQAQPGNPTPRLFRLPQDRALINRMGFNNHGAQAIAHRLAKPRRTIVGVNIGKTKLVPADSAVDDYVQSARLLGRHADYFVINVSSPNTPGLRDLQAVDKLRPLLTAVRETLAVVSPTKRIPLLVKVAPDLADEDLVAIAHLAVEEKLNGIIATNTTISRAGLATPQPQVDACGHGGLSGAPLHDRALQVLRLLRRAVGSQLTLISVGGIENADQAWERIRAGATLVQLYTAFIYEGPALAQHIANGLAHAATAAGYDRIQDAVGSDSG